MFILEKLTGRQRVPYKGNNIIIDGMPVGIRVKNPQAYKKEELEQILAVEHQLTQMSSKYISLKY